MTTQKLVLTTALLAVLGTACGGSNNGKLNRRVSQAHLAPVSAADRSAEAEAQTEFFLSEWQVAFTESQVRAAKLDIDIAKNALASAKLAVKNAKLERKAADESNDQNAIAEKKQAERIAELNIEVHKLAIERAKQSKRYLDKRLMYEQRSLRSREAAVELARAKSLQAAGIKPPNFDAKKYKAQYTERAANAKAAKASVDAEKTKLGEIEKQLLGAKNAVATAEGSPVLQPPPDPVTPMEPLEGDTPPETTPEPETTPPNDAQEDPEQVAPKEEEPTPETPATPDAPDSDSEAGDTTAPAPTSDKPTEEPKS